MRVSLSLPGSVTDGRAALSNTSVSVPELPTRHPAARRSLPRTRSSLRWIGVKRGPRLLKKSCLL